MRVAKLQIKLQLSHVPSLLQKLLGELEEEGVGSILLPHLLLYFLLGFSAAFFIALIIGLL